MLNIDPKDNRRVNLYLCLYVLVLFVVCHMSQLQVFSFLTRMLPRCMINCSFEINSGVIFLLQVSLPASYLCKLNMTLKYNLK